MPKTAWVVAGGCAVLVAFVCWVLGGALHGTTLAAASDVALVALTIPVIALVALAARAKSGRIRLAWLALTFGIVAWAVGEAIWTYYEVVLKEEPFPSAADVAFLLFPVASCVALLILPGGDAGPFRGRALLDGLIVAASLFVVELGDGSRPRLQCRGDRPARHWPSRWHTRSPTSSCLTLAAVVLVRSGSGDRLPLTLVTAVWRVWHCRTACSPT